MSSNIAGLSNCPFADFAYEFVIRRLVLMHRFLYVSEIAMDVYLNELRDNCAYSKGMAIVLCIEGWSSKKKGPPCSPNLIISSFKFVKRVFLNA